METENAMTRLSQQQTARLTRYHGQSVRLLGDAMQEARQSRWLRCEELLWGSVTLAVRGVALSRGDEIEDRQAVEQYANRLGQENNDRRIRDAFSRLSSFADAADRARESRSGAQHLIAILEDVTSAVDRLWEILPIDEPREEPDLLVVDDEPAPPPVRRSARARHPRRRRMDRDDGEYE